MDTVEQVALEVLDEAECRRLLALHSIGRIGVIVGAEPLVMPVQYAVDGGDVVFRTAAGSHFDELVSGAHVCFEIDGADPSAREGWSVLGRGVVRVVDDGADVARCRELPLQPWARQDRPRFLRLRLDHLSGRRVVPDGDEPMASVGPVSPMTVDLADAPVYLG